MQIKNGKVKQIIQYLQNFLNKIIIISSVLPLKRDITAISDIQVLKNKILQNNMLYINFNT